MLGATRHLNACCCRDTSFSVGLSIGIARQGGLLPPFSTAYVKGWKRGTMLLATLEAIRVLELENPLSIGSRRWVHGVY